jgi:hypothetical protein
MQPQLIAGRYQVLRAIGRGGMGTVWLCRDEILGRDVAVKQIGALPGDSATQTKRAMREARSAAALNHPNAVAVYDVVEHEGRPWLVMEYVEGQTLAAEISRDGQLSPQRVADIGAQLASALARAHERRIVHRDIKPGNVLIDKNGRPKISDFGIARGYGDEQLTQVGFVTGTPGFLSPELARGGDPHPASDVWALGATLYAAVEGQPPYESRSNPIALLRAIATERPRPMTYAGAIRPAIDAMMHEDPTCRWDMATSARRLAGIARANLPSVTRPVDPAVTRVFPVPLLETPPAEAQPVEAGRRVPEAVEPQPVETQPVGSGGRKPEPVETQPVESAGRRPEPVETQPVESAGRRPEPVETQLVESAGRKPEPVETQRVEPPPVEPPPVETPRRRPAASRDLPAGAAAPVAEKASALASGPAASRDLRVGPDEPPPENRRRGRRRLPVAFAALLVAVLGVAFLSNQLGDQNGTAAHPGTTAKLTPTKATPTPTTATSPETTEPASTPSSVPTTTPTTVPPKADKSLASFVSSYYSNVTENTDRTWGQLTPKMQGFARGRRSYDRFWNTIRNVRVNQVRPNASATSAVVSLTFTKNDGGTSTETYNFTFVKNGAGYLIDSDR